LDLLCKAYLSQPKETLELEARFGTLPFMKVNDSAIKKNAFKGTEKEYLSSFGHFVKNNRFYNSIKKNNFDNVVRILKKMGFNTGLPQETLKIATTFSDKGKSTLSNIRTHVTGASNIQDYCNTNSILKMNEEEGSMELKPYVTFINKRNLRDTDLDGIEGVDASLYMDEYNPERVNAHYDVPELNFRVSLEYDSQINPNSGIIKDFVKNWENRKKTFRLVKRYSFTHHEYPNFEVHMSMIRSSKRIPNRYAFQPEYTVKDSGVLLQPEDYEIEIEAKNPGTISLPKFVGHMRKIIRFVLCGLQNTQYPISYFDMYKTLNGYHSLVTGEPLTRRVLSNNFIGPSSISLEMQHLVPTETVEEYFETDTTGEGEEKQTVKKLVSNDYTNTILKYYTVTDKADGERRMMYVNHSGLMYLIDTNMNVTFTGLKTENATLYNSLVDGEYIANAKNGDFLHMYAMFDIYYLNGKDQRKKAFTRMHDEETPEGETIKKEDYRLGVLSHFAQNLQAISTIETKKALDVRMKTFKYGSVDYDTSIFDACKDVLSAPYEYETDGLIFTPAQYGVGMETIGDKLKDRKYTWMRSFKWKPPKYNTIDFLVSTQKNADKNDMIHSVYQSGTAIEDAGANIQEYKTLILRVGYDIKKHGYENPYQMVMDGLIQTSEDGSFEENNQGYKPVPFYPEQHNDTKNPRNSHICNLMVKTMYDDGTKVMFAEDGEVIEDDTIVEFAYDPTLEPGWRWKPLRVRHDKTAERRSGQNNCGNAYHVANSVWNSIHNPISIDMISSGDNIPTMNSVSDAYYNRDSGDSKTRSLRNFHNLYVKNKLILSIAKNRDVSKLMDVAVGKGGDFSKWINANIKFVFGVDVSKDNIENRVDGACARYLRYKKTNPSTPDCVFIQADSGLNIRSGDACYSEKAKEVVYALFNNSSRVAERALPKGIRKYRGMLENGADVLSCQFALHYFFADVTTLHNFMRNISDCCRVGGYFVGTCYDGQKVFNTLEDVKPGEYVREEVEGKRIWEIRKMYSQTEFENNSSSVGLAIDVYQETINKVFREYLVNFDYFVRLMDHYGFSVLKPADAKRIGMPNGSGLFDELYNSMKDQIKYEEEKYGRSNLKTNVRDAVDLEFNPEQQKVSFLNRYFIFKKTRNVNTKIISDALKEKKESDDTTPLLEALKKKTKKSKTGMVNAKTGKKPKKITITGKKGVPKSQTVKKVKATKATKATKKIE
jgi:hypothetical protein